MKVFKNKIKAFTIIELVAVVTIIWILIMTTTIYLGWLDERRKIIEWQWCANTLWGELRNFVFYALTSKNLKLSEDEIVSPEYYIVQLTGTDNCFKDDSCGSIVLSFATWDDENLITEYKKLTPKACYGNSSRLIFYRTWGTTDEKYVKMNKWFSIKKVNEKTVFYVKDWSNKSITWDIIIGLCINSECSSPKEISKFAVDWRSQTISVKNCKYYDEDPTICKTREDCMVYNSSDPTLCDKY